MEQSFAESDISMSPSQLLERLQLLRQLQVLQRGKLLKHRLDYNDSPQTSSSITEIVSKFSNSTSYNTFLSLLQSSENVTSPRQNTSKIKETDLVDGVSILNSSHDSEPRRSPVTSKSSISPKFTNEASTKSTETCEQVKQVIQLDEMPILSPKKDFEALLIEKLRNEPPNDAAPKSIAPKSIAPRDDVLRQKKPYLKRGQGMSRFGLKKNDLVIQNTNSLPWKKGQIKEDKKYKTLKENNKNATQQNNVPVQVEIKAPEQNTTDQPALKNLFKKPEIVPKIVQQKQQEVKIKITPSCEESRLQETKITNTLLKPNFEGKHPLLSNNNKSKTWASILTKEQDEFLRQLKQSNYYKNFTSPAKSEVSDVSCDGDFTKLQQERELAEQKMFDLLEKKVSHNSFSLENSFFNRFLKKTHLECSGESTPLVMQKCLAKKPELLGINPGVPQKKASDDTHSETGTCSSEYTDCDHETCSSVSTCCSCKTIEVTTCQQTKNPDSCEKDLKPKGGQNKEAVSKHKQTENIDKQAQNGSTNDNNEVKANMAEMNAKLVATSELLKDRLQELEDEIDTFRKENANLTKMREEVDLERQKFYEEKSAFEQKCNEDKILSEYYLAEEKEKLLKQKQVYERYVREMRGRLNKKDKDEVVNLKGEISNLKEEIRIKDAKSTSTIARLRNQLKIMEKEKKELLDEVEKLKKENRRIQHSNEVTRRLTNIKYLEEINKKLRNMSNKDTQSEVHSDRNVRYKAFEIERQSRRKTVQPAPTRRPRAKSVPNLKVTSRYAKYFSQRDSARQMDRNKEFYAERCNYVSDDDDYNAEENNNLSLHSDKSINDISEDEVEDNLERIYNERFKSNSNQNSKTSLNNSDSNSNSKDFFLTKSSSASSLKRDSKSPRTLSPSESLSGVNTSCKSPVSVISHRTNSSQKRASDNIPSLSGLSSCRTKSPVSILSNRVLPTICQEAPMYPEPASKTSLTKTTLTPTEIKKPDGSKELRFPNGNVKYISADGTYSKFVYYNGDVKENFYGEGRLKYYYAETKTYHTTHSDGLEVLEFADGQVEKRYKDGSTEIRLPNGSVRYHDPKNSHVREEWRFPDGTRLTTSANGEQRVLFSNGQVEVHAKDHKRREFPDGTVKLVYNDGTTETRYASGRVRVKDRHGTLLMDSAQG